jgi:hypothetical protein
MGRAKNSSALAVSAQPRPRTRKDFVLAAESVIATRDIAFHGIDYENEDYDDFNKGLSIREPIAPWPIANELIFAYQTKQQQDHERGLRVANPRSRKRAPEVQIPLLDRTALTWIVEAQQLAASDMTFSVYNGYYGPEVDYIRLDAPNIDVLARAYFALPNNPEERLRWLVQGVEGAPARELEDAFTFEATTVPFEAINESVAENDLAAAWHGVRTSLAATYNEHTRLYSSEAPDPVLAVVSADAGGYRIISGAKRLRGLDPSVWPSVPVYLITT